MSFHNTTPLYIELLESGLHKAKYQQLFNNELWTHQETWKLIGGIRQWVSKESDLAFNIHLDETTPLLERIPDPTVETLNPTYDNANNLISDIKAEIELNRTQNIETQQIIQWTPPQAKIVTPGKMIMDGWFIENLSQYIPEKTKRFYKFTLEFSCHCQIITNASVEHISFLHQNSMDGAVIAGGAPSNDNNQTSFDLTLSPGTYYIELFAWGFPGNFNLILHDNCINDLELPYMYDDNNLDAFGNLAPAQNQPE